MEGMEESIAGVQTEIPAEHSPIISLERYGWRNKLRTLRKEQVKVKLSL
jgi:hypothetical protein